jgi:integrase
MVGYVLAGKVSRAERRRKRKSIVLEDAALSDKTQRRYYSALRKLTPWIERATHENQLDSIVCSWIHHMWKDGEPLLTVGDALSAFHFYEPWSKRKLPHSWKLFSVWRRIEIPSRAPPLTLELVRSMASFELSLQHLEMATLLLLSFHCLLRTGEALKLRAVDFTLNSEFGICSLKETKSGRRNSANEAISITDPVVLDVVSTLCEVRKGLGQEMLPLWSASGSAFRTRFRNLCISFGLQRHSFRPYSLRRGGATHCFQTSSQPMETALLRGRWESTKVAKVYIMDALSYLPAIRRTRTTTKMLKKYHF